MKAAYRVPRAAARTDLFLDSNEGPLLSAPPSSRRYPRGEELERELARRFKLEPEQVFVSAGADESLDRIARCFLGPGRRALMPAPGFEMVERYVASVGGELATLPWDEGAFPLDAAREALATETAVVFLTSPNNPNGLVLAAADLKALRAAAPEALLVIDLAYAEFADEDLTAAALALPGPVLVLRTFSKAWGLADLRVGYTLGEAALLDRLRAVASPYPVSGRSRRLALRRLRRGEETMQEGVARVREERTLLASLMEELALAPVPSQANFILGRSSDPDELRDRMAGLGIAIRSFPDRPRLEDAFRIGLPGRPQEYQRLEQALRTAVAPEALLFDLDGVLADVGDSYRAAIRGTAASYGVIVGETEIQERKAQGDANDDWRLTWELLADAGVDAPLAEVTARFESLYQGEDERPGLWRRERLTVAAGRLRMLAQQLPLAIVTGRPRRDTARFLDQFDLRSCFSAVVCREDAALKPSPEPVRLALRRLGVTRAWMVGDTVDDLRAARAAGVLPWAVQAPGLSPALAAADRAALLPWAAAVLPDLDALFARLP